MHKRDGSGLFWPTLLTGVAMLVLIGLGTWQLERKAWKDGLVQRIQQSTRADPIVLDAAAALLARGENLEYARVRARGRYLAERTRYYFAPEARGAGWHAYTPLETPSGLILMVNRGWVSEADRQARVAEAAQHSGRETEVVGLLRQPVTRSMFSPVNDAERNRWFWRDLDGMLKSAFPGEARRALPFFLDAEAGGPASDGARVPRAGTTILSFPNRHLEYALTWYGLAVTLLGVYAAFALQRVRGARSRTMFGRS